MLTGVCPKHLILLALDLGSQAQIGDSEKPLFLSQVVFRGEQWLNLSRMELGVPNRCEGLSESNEMPSSDFFFCGEIRFSLSKFGKQLTKFEFAFIWVFFFRKGESGRCPL